MTLLLLTLLIANGLIFLYLYIFQTQRYALVKVYVFSIAICLEMLNHVGINECKTIAILDAASAVHYKFQSV